MAINSLLWRTESTGAVPLSLFFYLSLFWFTISVPLAGWSQPGHEGRRAQVPRPHKPYPRQIPQQRFPVKLLLLGDGILAFGTLCIELFFIISSLWLQHSYYKCGFLLIVLILLVIVCAQVLLSSPTSSSTWRSTAAGGDLSCAAGTGAFVSAPLLHRMRSTHDGVKGLGSHAMAVGGRS